MTVGSDGRAWDVFSVKGVFCGVSTCLGVGRSETCVGEDCTVLVGRCGSGVFSRGAGVSGFTHGALGWGVGAAWMGDGVGCADEASCVACVPDGVGLVCGVDICLGTVVTSALGVLVCAGVSVVCMRCVVFVSMGDAVREGAGVEVDSGVDEAFVSGVGVRWAVLSGEVGMGFSVTGMSAFGAGVRLTAWSMGVVTGLFGELEGAVAVLVDGMPVSF